MSEQMLKILIQSACETGTISDSDKEIIYRKGQQIGMNKEKIDQMISDELSKNVDEGLESGFMSLEKMEEEQPKKEENISTSSFQTKFTNLTPLSYQGAMSTVYQAKLYGKWIIIKRIKPEFKNNAQYKELFIREFDNAYHLDHPHIVRLLDKGEDEDGLYYTMEFIDGRPLSEMLKENGLNNDRLSERIARQIIDALHYVHKKQIYHRDLKPDNIYVTFRGDNVKIIDFGLAAADNYDDNLAKAGTPRYASPEQMNPKESIDQRADIFSFGKIFLEMLTGDTKIEDLDKISNPAHRYIVEKSLAENKEERFNDCDEVLDIFRNPSLVPERDVVQDVPEKNEKTETIDKHEKKDKTEKKQKSTKKILIPIIAGISIAILVAVYFIFIKDNSSNLFPNKKTENLVAKADSLFNASDFVQAKDVYESIKKKDEHINNQINLLKDIVEKFEQADKVFLGKNIARALKMFEKIAEEYPDFKQVTDRIAECKQIIEKADFNSLQVVPESSTDKLGFADKYGNVIIDYQFDEVAPLKDWHKKGLIPVMINKKYGFVDRNKNYFAKCEYSADVNGKYVWLPSGYRVLKNGRTVAILIDSDGNGYIK